MAISARNLHFGCSPGTFFISRLMKTKIWVMGVDTLITALMDAAENLRRV